MLGDTPAGSLVLGLAGLGVDLHMAHDCRPPRAAGESVPEGMKASCSV